MSHLLVFDLPGGNDSDVLSAALALGHRVTLATADPAHYRAQAALAPLRCNLGDNRSCVMPLPSDGTIWPDVIAAAHVVDPFDAVLCLQDVRLVEAARVAQRLGLAHLSAAAAALCRDKAAVRARLADAGIAQPAFAIVEPGRDAGQRLIDAVRTVGVPAMIKPVDGFGSQHIFAVRGDGDLGILYRLADLVAQGPGDYGLGTTACGTLLVERLFEGPLLACDVMRSDRGQALLGINHKIMCPPPSFVVQGGCFTANCGQFGAIETWLTRVLDAVGFDVGAAHVELMMTADGPQLVEINPRLVGARIARQMDAALGRSVHADLIALHLDGTLPPPADTPRHAVARWLCAPDEGTLDRIDWPPCDDPALVGIVPFARCGDLVRPALDNADRLALVMTCGADQASIEALANHIVAQAKVSLTASASGIG